MAKGVIDFASAPVQAGVPAGWTNRWSTTVTVAVVQDGWNFTGRAMKITRDATSGQYPLLSVDALDNKADIELLVEYSLDNVTYSATSTAMLLYARCSGDHTTRTGYGARMQPGETGTGGYVLRRYLSATMVNIGTGVAPPAIDQSKMHYMRFRIAGSAIKSNRWRTGETENAGWDISATDTNITAAGWVGLGVNMVSNSTYVHRLAWSDEGEKTAVFTTTPAISGLSPAPPFLVGQSGIVIQGSNFGT